MNEEFNVDFNTIRDNKLSFEAYFLLWCINFKKEVILLDYIKLCRKIPTEIIIDLEERQLLTIDRTFIKDNNITYSMLSLTIDAKRLFTTSNFKELFTELRTFYPKEAKGRKLHQNLKRCEKLYKSIIGNNIELHNLICKCAVLYHNEKKRSNSEEYMQLLETWLFQENFVQYLDEAKKINLSNMEGVQSEDI